MSRKALQHIVTELYPCQHRIAEDQNVPDENIDLVHSASSRTAKTTQPSVSEINLGKSQHGAVNWMRFRVLFISPEGIINYFLSLVYRQAVYKRVYKPPAKIASRGLESGSKQIFCPRTARETIPKKHTDARFPNHFDITNCAFT
jgi:hypothetical protein